MQGQSGLFRIGVADEQGVAGDGAGVIIEDDRQPGSDRVAGPIEDRDVEQGVVGLPLLVGPGGDSSEDQFEPVPVCGLAMLGQGSKSGVDALDDLSDAGVTGGSEAAITCDVTDAAVDICRGGFRVA